ncbi:MAG: DUF1015 family protein [Ignavibacteria bacterium]|nr:DUF1015 family protein [Ignavibacteria bacterium]
MATVRPFKAFRPKPEFAGEVAAKPYDVLSSDEARREVEGNPLSFLHIGKPEIDLDPTIDPHDPRVYARGKENLQKLIDQKVLIEDPAPSLYVYAQTMEGRTQYGIVGCASVEEYLNDTIKKHELTRKDKEEDRCNHVRVTNSHSGPIFLTYPDNAAIDAIVAKVTSQPPENDHIASDGIRHQTWIIKEAGTIQNLQGLFGGIRYLYVADGHHRTAAAAVVGRERKLANPNHRGDEEYNFFLAVCFPASQLKILDYNRVVKDLNGLSMDQFFEKVKQAFSVRHIQGRPRLSKKGEFGLYLDGEWYLFSAPGSLLTKNDPVERLDVTILQQHLLDPILGIKDPRVEKRIDFVGGIRGLGELEKRVDSGEMAVAISMFPTSIHELIAIADAGKIMPPKSTWFEPKLRDGLFVHFLD